MLGRDVSQWLALAGLIALLWVARGVLTPFIVAGILAYMLSPLVDQLADRARIPRQWVALSVFAAVVLVFGVLLWLIGARLNGEIRELGRQGPNIVETIVTNLTGGKNLELFGQRLSSTELGRRVDAAIRDELGTPTQAFQAVRTGIEWSLNLILVLLALAYLLLDGHRFWNYWLRFVPPDHRGRVETLASAIHLVLARYIRGQLLLIVLMSTVTFLALEWLFHLPYALWIGILTGLLEIIPLVGPVTAGAVACAVGFTQGGVGEAAGLALLYFVLRQTEDQVVMPIVVGRAVHVHPLVTIFAVLTGEKIAGVLGMVLAVPIAAAIKVVLDYAYPPKALVEEQLVLPETAVSPKPTPTI
jgi:predicted PurR-regulated permease PerM